MLNSDLNLNSNAFNTNINDINIRLGNEKLSVMNFLNEITLRNPTAISFAPGRPKEEFFDVERSLGYISDFVEYQSNINNQADMDYSTLGQYGDTKGIVREVIAKFLLKDQGVKVDPEDILITVGCQEAMAICLLTLFSSSNEVLLVESPGYVGITGVANILGVEIVEVPINKSGIDIEALTSTLDKLSIEGKRAKAIYLSPDFSNPTGISTDNQVRQALIKLSNEHAIFLLEDHAYNYFYEQDIAKNSLISTSGSQYSIYLGSFSKTVFPSVRLGILVTNHRLKRRDGELTRLSDEMSKVKSYLTVNTPSINQAILGGLLIKENYSLVKYTQARRESVNENKKLMLQALEKYFPKSDDYFKDITWNQPKGGYFLTLTLPFDVTKAELQYCIENYGVIWCPMSFFYNSSKSSNCIRLSFSYENKTNIEQGIHRLAMFVKDMIVRLELMI